MALPEQILGSGANATVHNVPKTVITGDTIRAVQQGMANNYRDPKWVGNPEFDARARSRSGAGGVKEFSNLYRGYITQMRKEVNEIPGSGGPKRRRLDFQYNPTQVSLNYSINTDAFPSESRASEDTAPILAAMGQTLSWTLYFNRTYEMLTRAEKGVGVMADVQSMEYLLGSRGDGDGVAAVECMVVFGMTKSGKPLAFAGWISDLNVTFLQFTHRMIPTVAMVEVGMVRRFVNFDTATALSADGVVTSSPVRGGGSIVAADRAATQQNGTRTASPTGPDWNSIVSGG